MPCSHHQPFPSFRRHNSTASYLLGTKSTLSQSLRFPSSQGQIPSSFISNLSFISSVKLHRPLPSPPTYLEISCLLSFLHVLLGSMCWYPTHSLRPDSFVVSFRKLCPVSLALPTSELLEHYIYSCLMSLNTYYLVWKSFFI